VGLRNLEKASALTTIPVTIQWEPFFLNENTPEEGEDLFDHISKKYGPAMAARFSNPDNPLSQAGKKVGINFNPSRRLISTVRCHIAVDHVNKEFGIEKGNELATLLSLSEERKAEMRSQGLQYVLDNCTWSKRADMWVTQVFE
jgi:predicted DsbA family dithiol-disulfide isomerase